MEEPLASAHSRKPRSMFLCMSACVYVCACTHLCARVYVHKGRNTGSLWPQQRHLGAGRASTLGSSERVHTPCVLVYTLVHLVCTDLQQHFLATGALSDSTPSPALRSTSPCTSPQSCRPVAVPGTKWVLTSAKSMAQEWSLDAPAAVLLGSRALRHPGHRGSAAGGLGK